MRPDGGIAAQSGGITLAAKPAAGTYILSFGSAVTGHPVIATAGYAADHWCEKGHVLLCLEGELTTELADGRIATLKPGMSYQVADGAEPHCSTASGARR